MPMTVITVLFILSLVVRKPVTRRRLLGIAVGLLLVLSNDFLANEAMLAWELPARSFSETGKHRLGIVLTGTTMSNMVPDDRVYFHKGADRVTHTVHLYKLGLLERILISGGSGRLSGETEPEANKFLKAMVMMGVDSADIIIENETRNTYESAMAVKPMLDSLGYRDEDCLLITSAFHMRRSLACYRKAGVSLDYFTTDFYTHSRDYTLDSFLIPKPEAIMIWHKLVREWIGLVAYKVAGYV